MRGWGKGERKRKKGIPAAKWKGFNPSLFVKSIFAPYLVGKKNENNHNRKPP